MTEPFDAVSVIRTKRDRGRIPDAEIDWVIDAYTRGVVADEQMSALAMAILLNGMQADELSRWTAAMIASGERLDLSGVRRPTTDKHSTGGVGDKITLPLAPLVAALRRRRPAAVRPRPRPHRRHPGQAGVDPGLAGVGVQRRVHRPAQLGRRGGLRGRRRAGAGRQEAVRAAGRDRHGRGDPADRQLDHEQEDRRGLGRAGAGRQGRHRRVHAARSPTPGSWPRPWSRWAPRPAPTPSRCSPT